VRASVRSAARILDTIPYIRDLRRVARDVGAFPPGHFYSPTPSHAEVLARLAYLRRTKPVFDDIRIDEREQLDLLKAFAAFYDELPFPERKSEECRFYYSESPFPYPDAIFLYSFLRHTTPANIIEVGSGRSSGVILDTVDRFFSAPPRVTFIEPYPANLNQMLRRQDRANVTIIEDKLQNTPLDLFTSLGRGDLLFIDSSHVLKCGSDVQFLFFEVLPRLPGGVFVHFHDVLSTFEYPEEWLLQGWYWNESYFVRAFMSYNSEWKVYFFNNYVRLHFEDFLAKEMPLCLKDVGGSLYIQKTAGS
jgi:hypothetical protein